VPPKSGYFLSLKEENLMYALAEYAVIVLVVMLMGGFFLAAVAAFVIAREGFNTVIRALRARFASRQSQEAEAGGVAVADAV
jgi:hypothetical protein